MKSIKNYILKPHAKFEIARRGLNEEIVNKILSNPEQRTSARLGRDVFQSQIMMEGKEYLVRVFVDIDRNPAEVVTAYRTSKILKYWESEK